jgi:hypothetical protein
MSVPLPIKPLIAFTMLENEKISRLALEVLKEVAQNSLVNETKQEAIRNVPIIEDLLKTRHEINLRNKQRAIETFNV